MEEYRSNSLKQRDGTAEEITEKRVESVVSGSATAQKKSGLSKFASSMIAEDLHSVGSWLFSEVLIPSCKKAISDIVTNGIDMLLYGKASGSRSYTSASKISYGSYYSKPYGEPVKAGSGNGSFDYDSIVFDNRGDAEAVLTSMGELVDQFGVVSVGDLYDLANIPSPNYTVNKYGWTTLRNAQVMRCRDGYTIRLPKATVLNN